MAPWFGAVAAAELTYKVEFTGEAAELVFGLLFLADGLLRLDGWRVGQGQFSVKPLLALMTFPLLLGFAAVPASALLVYGSDEDLVTLTGRELDLLRADIRRDGAADASLFRKSSIHKRLFTAVRKGYFQFGDRSGFLGNQISPAEADGPNLRRDRAGYFLDPWNNPYWIRYIRNRQRGVIYSFGPNRRRDSDFSRIGNIGGDDIGVVFRLRRSR